MDSNHESSGGSGTVPEGETAVAETVEIKIKTLDSQSHSVRVEKNVTVPALKEHLASVVGVPAENQRLICRGKVLKDDQLLSAYNVEDGHTLHLVARQPPPASGVGSSTVGSEGGQGATGLPPAGSRSGHVSHSLLMGTINFPDNGEGQLPDLNRIINAVISSIGMHGGVPLQGGAGNPNTVSVGVLPTPASMDAEGADGRSGAGEQDTGVRELEVQIDALYGMPSGGAGASVPSPIRVVQAPVVVPDALTTMSQYLDRLELSFAAQESARLPSAQQNVPAEVRPAPQPRPSGEDVRRGPSPAALGALVNRVNSLLSGQANSALSRLASELENEPTMVDAAAREDVQSRAVHDGNVMQQLGALLLELGRATLTLRMGQSPTESVVNTGPAIFISPTGPNPMMVQGTNVASFRQVFDLSGIHRQNISLPVQPAGGVTVGTALPPPPTGTLGPSPGVPGPPRSIHIHIHTSDPGALSNSPSPSLTSAQRPFSSEEVVRIPAGPSGLVRQLLERAADPRSMSQYGGGAVQDDAAGPVRPERPLLHPHGPEGDNNTPSAGPTAMQGALMTIDENGTMRVVPVRSRGSGHHSNSFDPLVGRIHHHQLVVRPASNNMPSETAPPGTAASMDSARHMDTTSRSLPGEGVNPSGAGGGEANLMSSLAPILQHIAGAFQQGAPTLPQQQSNTELQRQPTTITDVRQAEAAVRPTEEAQTSRELPSGGSGESVGAAETGVTNMVTDVVSGDNERPGSVTQSVPEETQDVGQGGALGGGMPDAPATTAPMGLGLGGLQLLQPRGRRRRQQQQASAEEHRQAAQDALQNLIAQRDLANGSLNQNGNAPSPMAAIGNLVRAVGGGGGSDRQQAGPNIIGQLMRSPVMENLVQQVMHGVGDVDVGGGTRRGPGAGGIDLSGMLQQMMPVVSQMLGGGGPPSVLPRSSAGTSARATTEGGARESTSRQSEPDHWQDALTQEEAAGWSETIAADEEAQQSMPAQRPFSDAYSRGTPSAKRQKTEVDTVAEKLEDGGSAEAVLRDLAGAASADVSTSNGTIRAADLAQHVAGVDGLAEAYLVVLFNDLAARVAADPDFGNGSRFPHAARVFRQSPEAATE